MAEDSESVLIDLPNAQSWQSLNFTWRGENKQPILAEEQAGAAFMQLHVKLQQISEFRPEHSESALYMQKTLFFKK